MADTKVKKTDEKIVPETTVPKFNKPDFQNFGANKFRPVFKPLGRFQSINRSRR